MSNCKMKKGLILAAILLLPSIVYLLFSKGEHHVARLGYYGDIDSIRTSGDTVYKPMDFPELVGENGQEFDLKAHPNRVILVHVFQSPCDENCKTNMATLNNYLYKTGLKERWMILSICLDSVSRDVLEDLAVKGMYSGGNWFYTSVRSSSDGQRFVDDCFVKTKATGSREEIPRTTMLLFDQSHRLRGFFNLKLQDDNKKMEDAIKVLMQEPHISWKEKKK